MHPVSGDTMTTLLLGLLAIGTALLFHDVISWVIGVVILLLAFGAVWLISRAACRGAQHHKDGP